MSKRGPTAWGGAIAPYKCFWRAKNLGAGRIHFARAVKVPTKIQKEWHLHKQMPFHLERATGLEPATAIP